MDTIAFIQQVEKIYTNWGWGVVFLGSLVETSPIGFTIPGGLIVALGGFYSYGKPFALVGYVISGCLGMFTTFFLAYLLGRNTGHTFGKLLRQERNLNRAKILLDKHGPTILTTSLMASLTRFWVSYAAGIQNYNIFKFSFYAVVASLTWNSLFVIVGYLAGSERQQLESGLAKLGILAWLLVVVAVFIIYTKSKKEFSASNEKSIEE